MPWRVKGKFLWIGEVGGFGKISFIALHGLPTATTLDGISLAGEGFGAHGGADYVPSLRRLAPLGAFRAHALWIFQPMTLPS